MPQFLETKLKKQYGQDNDIPYKIMNARGYMRGSKETAKGRALEQKHVSDMLIASGSAKAKQAAKG